MSTPAIDTLGLIAGSRTLPFLIVRQARLAGVRKIVVVGFENETSPELAGMVDHMAWIRVGQMTPVIETFRKHGVTQCVMAGQVAPKNLFDLRPDLRALKLLWRIKERNAHTLFGAVADELQREGITLIEATPWLRPYMPETGFHLGPKLSDEQREDVQFGYRIAKEISRLEIGQTVVVKEGTVLAVEGFEGTDACLTRGGQLAGPKGGGVAVKVAKARHDMRFDIPCFGPQTLESCARSGVAVLAVESGKTLALELEQLGKLAKEQRVSIVAVSGNSDA